MWRWSRFQRHNWVVFFFLFALGGARFIFNSHFVGKVALELGPAPDVASFFLIRAEIEKFTKRVAVRAVELSSGAFCTEFRCEQLCDDVIFSIFHEKGRRESCGVLDHRILHRIPVRIQPRGRFFSSSRLGKLDFSGFPAGFGLIFYYYYFFVLIQTSG